MRKEVTTARPTLRIPRAAAAAYLLAQTKGLGVGIPCRHCPAVGRSRVLRTMHVTGATVRERRCLKCKGKFCTTERLT